VFVTGMEHSIVRGTGWQTTPWEAVQQPAFQALHRGGIGVTSQRFSKAVGR
jgi:hypothetical protein